MDAIRKSEKVTGKQCMNLVSAKHFSIGLAMLITARFALAMKPTQKLADRLPPINIENIIPKRFGEWSVEELQVPSIVSPEVKAALNKTYDQMVSRTYIDSGGQRLVLLVAYGSLQNNDLKAHRQEVCYRTQGFNVQNTHQTVLNLAGRHVKATRMFAERGKRQEAVTYWFTMGNTVVYSRLERLSVQIKYSLYDLVPDGFLIRISSFSSSPIEAYMAQEKFADELLSAMRKSDVERLVGTL